MLKKPRPLKGKVVPIVQAGDAVLREAALPVDVSVIGTPDFESLIDSMIETMRDAPGVGLAAPQIGVSLQVAVLEDRPETVEEMDSQDADQVERAEVPLTVLINPTLEPVDGESGESEKVTFYEGCLSVSGWAAMTPRSYRVKVRALGRNGEPIELDWKGWPARILQHELDHLAGTLYIDRMDSRTFTTTEYSHSSEE